MVLVLLCVAGQGCWTVISECTTEYLNESPHVATCISVNDH